MRTVLFTVSAMVMGLAATAASAQASSWSVDNGPSLFQSLGINVPKHEARSQILPSNIGDYSVIQSPVLKSSSRFPANFSTRRNLSVPDPSTDRIPVLGEMAGPSPVSPPRASFVPQIAQFGGETDPVLMAQVQEIETRAEPGVAAMMPVSISTYWGDILGKYTRDDNGLTRFDYAGLKAGAEDMDNLGKYIDNMAGQKPSKLTRDDAMAYWANLYNALTVQVVVQNYPVKSIRKIKSGYRSGPWKRDLVVVENRKLSLDDIEHNILRPTYQTPLVHYMVNCASVGCPNLKTTLWQGATLAADQEAAARAYINSQRGAKINNGRLQVSSIYRWFKADFGGNQAGVLAHLRQYADADLRAALEGRRKIDKYAYDWNVNTPK